MKKTRSNQEIIVSGSGIGSVALEMDQKNSFKSAIFLTRSITTLRCQPLKCNRKKYNSDAQSIVITDGVWVFS